MRKSEKGGGADRDNLASTRIAICVQIVKLTSIQTLKAQICGIYKEFKLLKMAAVLDKAMQ
jgi:hypothetical protein